VDYLFRGDKGDTAKLQAQAAAYGVILEQHHVEPEHYQLWSEHSESLDLFLRCMTQWRSVGDSVIGLDYGVVLQLASLYQVSDPAKALEDLQVMELHAREKINKRLEQH
jgi:hypothetical protein